MSDAGTEGQWTALVFRYPPASPGPDSPTGAEYEQETRLLQEAGYETGVLGRGQTQHRTYEEAYEAVKDMIRRLAALDPKIEWIGKPVKFR